MPSGGVHTIKVAARLSSRSARLAAARHEL